MNLIIETQSQYLKEVLCNISLENLADEKWKEVEDFENYAISNYGRIKSLERSYILFKGWEKLQPEMIIKPFFIKQFNKYLDRNFYNVQCSFSSEGQKYRKSLPRLVYYHFIEKFDMNDRSILISFKDGDSLNVHSSNLEKISHSERRLKTFRNNRTRNRRVHYLKPVSQYTVEGDWVSNFESIYEAEKAVGVGCESIQDVINKEFLTAGGFRWFLQSSPPKKEDFIVAPKHEASGNPLNKFLWEKLGKPKIDPSNPPACMNLSLTNLPNEEWRPIPGFEDSHLVSSKGRVKRLSGWTSLGRKIFLPDQILSQTLAENKNKANSFYIGLYHNGRKVRVTTARLLYCCFVKEFDIYSKAQVVVNQNESWDIDITKLSLRSLA